MGAMEPSFRGVEGCAEAASGVCLGLHHALRIEDEILDC